MATQYEPLGDLPDRPHDQSRASHQQTRKRGSGLRWLIFGGLVIVAVLLVFFVGWLPRHKRQQEIDRQAHNRSTSLPRLEVVKVRHGPSTSELMVPGTTLAFTQAYIYARASGYVRRRLADIGDRVREGQLLATIDAPDLDKQVAQARSTLQESQSNLVQLQAQLHLAALTWERYKVLVAKGVFSRQDGDQQEANYRVAEANVRAAENTVQGNRENLERLVVLQGYERVTAPFDGVITDRNIDVGALITAQGTGLGESPPTTPGPTQSAVQGNNQGSSGALSSSASPSTGGAQGGDMFGIADITRLRILVSVPEAYTSVIHVGQRAKLYFAELPNRSFYGPVTRTSGSIDQNTRTLLVEVQVPNPTRQLLPGMYVVVNFVDVNAEPPLLIPGEAIFVRNGKTVVGLVKDDVVHFQPVSIGRDYGDQTEIVGGIGAGDIIAANISDEVRDGARIQPQFRNARQQPGGQSDKAPGQEGQYGNQSADDQAAKVAQPGKKKGGGSGSGNSGGKDSSPGSSQQ